MTQLAVAYGVGMLALVNPCGFMMLPAFLAYNITDGTHSNPRATRRLGRGVEVGLAVSLGFAGTFLVAGLLVSAGLRSLTEAVPWFSVVVGGSLMVLGLGILAGRQVGMSLGTKLFQRSGPRGGRMFSFGGAYALTQLACGMGSLLALVGQGMAASSPVGTATVFVAFSLGSTTMLLLLAVSSALMSDVLVRSVRSILPVVGRISGAVLTLTGAYLIVYWAPALLGGNHSDTWISRYVHDVSASTRHWLQGNELTVTLLAVLVVAVSAFVVVHATRSTAARPARDPRQQDEAAHTR